MIKPLALVVLLALASSGAAQQQRPARPAQPPKPSAVAAEAGPVLEAVNGHVMRPEKVDATDERIALLKAPEGFKVSVWARDLEQPRWFAAARDGALYVTSREAGTVTRLRDADNDGSAEEKQVILKDKPDIHGIWLDEERGQVFLVDIHTVYVAPLNSDGTFGELKEIVKELPDAGQHPNRTLAVGPDDKLYVSVGSLGNVNPASDERESTMLRCELDGSNVEVFAEGLRNTIGFGWHPRTGEFWGFDHGIDWLGDEVPREELNRLEEGKHYGHPFVWNDGNITPGPNEKPPEGFASVEEFARTVPAPALTYDAHAAPLQMAFYTGAQFPPEYRGDALVAMRGSWNRKDPSGYEVVRVDFDDAGKPTTIEPFVGRWLTDDGRQHFGRICGLAVLPDGSVLVGDDANGVIYRIEYAR